MQRLRSGSLMEVAALFLKLGLAGFGGPAAHMAMLDQEAVERRGWLSRRELADVIGLTNLIPGPNSTEVCMHIGYLRAGYPGLFVAGLCFIVPAVVISAVLGWAYVRYGGLPDAEGMLAGLRPAIVAVILCAAYRLGGAVMRRPDALVTGVGAMLLALAGVNEVLALFVSAAALLCWRARAVRSLALLLLSPLCWHSSAAAAAGAASGSAPTLAALGFYFLQIGSILYGSGYVLVSFLQGGPVESLGWLTRQQLLDAVAAGQFTPGPLVSTAAFAGYVIRGWPGAWVASAGMFLPSFVFVMVVVRFAGRARQRPWMSHLMDGFNSGSVGLMAAVGLALLPAAVPDAGGWAILAAAAAAILALRWNMSLVVLAGGALGLLRGLLSAHLGG